MPNNIDQDQFKALMNRLAQAWGEQDSEAAAACFTAEAVYMQPPDIQLYFGRTQLQVNFAALEPETYLHFQNLWFDEGKQTGCDEYSFGVTGRPTADHGTIVVEIQGGSIAFWREYHVKGPRDFAAFTALEDKSWQWHIGNYP